MTTRIPHPSRLGRPGPEAVPLASTAPGGPEPGTGTNPEPETPEKVGEEAEPDPRERDYPQATRAPRHLRLVGSTGTPDDPGAPGPASPDPTGPVPDPSMPPPDPTDPAPGPGGPINPGPGPDTPPVVPPG